MGRFWQSKTLSEQNPIFENIPIENMILQKQVEYYKAIEQSTQNTNSGIFIDFILELILNFIKTHIIQHDIVNLILQMMKENPTISYEEIAKQLGKSRATISRKNSELKMQGIIERIGTDKNGHWKINLLKMIFLKTHMCV